MAISIFLVDDKVVNRQTVKEKLYGYQEFIIIDEAKNGKDFLEKLKKHPKLPDIVLMDLEMPELNGIETIKIASAAYPNLKFIVLTVFEDNDKIFEAIKAGAGGYILKEDSSRQLIDAITNVYEYNGIPMSPVIARKAMELLKKLPLTPVDGGEPHEVENNFGITHREMDVLVELVSGKTYHEVGEKLFISWMTVRKHVSNIYKKLHVSTRAQLINIAYKQNWV